MTQDRNAGERDTPSTHAETPREPTPQELAHQAAKAKELQEIEDGHRYPTQEFLDAREAANPGADRKKGRGDKPEGAKKAFGDKKPTGDKKAFGAKGGKDAPKATERIAKVLARAGLASRREVERLIGLGKIAVNGRILETPAVLVSSADIITVDGQVIGKAEATRLWRYHKPVGLITTHSDPQGRPTLFEQLPSDLPRVISVGRLDLNSEGLLLLTNDGELARALEKPSSGWVRRYRVRALGNTTQARLDNLKHGTTVEGVIYGPMEASLDKVAEKADGRANVWLTVAITEGKNREVRKVLESIGLKVNRLIRLAYGPFQLGNLDTGAVEEVGPRVIRELLADIVPLRNLPPEGASQTQDASRTRGPRSDAPGAAAPQGRRGGGDRFETRPPRGKPAFAEKREYKPRDFDERPRFEGDGEARDRKPARDGDFKPRYDRKPSDAPRREAPSREGGDRPYAARKPYAAREGGDVRAEYTPRPDRGAGNDRNPASGPRREEGERARDGSTPYVPKPYVKKPYTPRPGGEGERAYGAKPYAKKPYTPREGGEGTRSYGAKPAYAKKPYAPGPKLDEAGAYDRAKREFGGGADRKPRTDRDGAAAGGYKKPYAQKSYDKKPYAPRPDRDATGGERSSAARPYGRPQGDRPTGDRPQGDRPAYKARDGAASGARKSYGDRPRGDYSKGPRSDGARPSGPRSDGPRPGGARPDGARPGGKPGGSKPPFKPRRDS